MAWFMVDDKLHGHRKRIRAGIEAMGLWVVAGSWCADHLNDGFVPDYVASELDSKWRSHSVALVRAGLWHDASQNGETGWLFHEWSGWQPTRADVLRKREQAKERVRRARERSREVTRNNSVTDGVTPAYVTPTPSQPNPSHPIRSSGSSSGGGSPPVTDADKRPPRYCPKHPDGTDDPCGKCADARKDYETWKPPTLSGKVTMCGEHPRRRALNCPECASETTAAPEGWRSA